MNHAPRETLWLGADRVWLIHYSGPYMKLALKREKVWFKREAGSK